VIKVALRGLIGRKLRSGLTAFAIVLGVAMVSGTFVLTDTISKAFDTIFTKSYSGSDAYISGKEAFSTDSSLPPSFDQSLLPKVRALPEVNQAVGGIVDSAKLVDKKGKTIGGGGPPTLAFGVDPSVPRFNPLKISDGRWPRGPTEIAIDIGTAKDKHFKVGDSIDVSAKGPTRRFKIAGIVKFGGVSSIGGATIAVFDIPTAQQLFRKQGKLDAISASAKRGVSKQELVHAIEGVLPPNTEVRTGAQEADEQAKDTRQGVSIFQKVLLAFAGIALFVGAFIIFNSLSITVAQRAREFALLRTIGASRRQVLGSVVLEAVVVGAVASLLGLFIGLGLAKLLNSIFAAGGIDLPQSGLVLATRTILISLGVGIAITLLASLIPAIRATRVEPVSILREGATVPRSRLAPALPYIALLVVALGIALLSYGLFVNGIGVAQRLAALGVGAFGVFMGVALVSSRVVQPLAWILGWPGKAIGGTAGSLARENASRNPGRTAVTAAALMIGITLVAFVSIFASGLRHSFRAAINDQLQTDYIVTSKDGFTPFDPAAAAAVAKLSAVSVTNVRGDQGKIGGDKRTVSGLDGDLIAASYRFDWVKGDDTVLSDLGSNGALTEADFAKNRGLKLGDRFTILSPSGRTAEFVLKGTYDPPAFGNLLGTVDIPTKAFDAIFPDPKNLYAFVDVPGGPNPTTTRDLNRALAPFPDVKEHTQDGFIKDQEKDIDNLLLTLYVLLALSVIISLFGIVNTLVLTVFERTREIGMLRAVGMTRRQVRRMIRHESVITALIGAALGLVVGIFLALLVTKALEGEGLVFSIPVVSLIIFVVVAIVAGVLAAILPARRAARLNVLEALQYE
jgi:putative ABC transport system permease protein